MNAARYTSYKNKLTNWLLAVTLFLSVFSSSGYASSYSAKQQQATQTELVISNSFYNAARRAVSFRKTFINNSFNRSYKLHEKQANALFTYNILNKVKLVHLSMQCDLRIIVRHFVLVKAIPQTSDEELSTSSIG